MNVGLSVVTNVAGTDEQTLSEAVHRGITKIVCFASECVAYLHTRDQVVLSQILFIPVQRYSSAIMGTLQLS
jgi:hypothetical protein